jgi:hypothetical protein
MNLQNSSAVKWQIKKTTFAEDVRGRANFNPISYVLITNMFFIIILDFGWILIEWNRSKILFHFQTKFFLVSQICEYEYRVGKIAEILRQKTRHIRCNCFSPPPLYTRGLYRIYKNFGDLSKFGDIAAPVFV